MSSSFTEEQLFNLPEDLDLAFVRLEELARQELEQTWAEEERTGNPAGTACEFDYMSHVLAAAEECGVEELMKWETPSVGDEDARVVCRNFRQDAKRVALKLNIRALRRAKGYTVAFDAATKAKLRHHLEQIRQTVDKLELSDAKKSRLHNCIDDLNREIGNDRTRTETYGALVMEVATIIDNASRPLSDAIWRLGTALGLAKASAREQQRLPAPKKPKQIEAPKPKADAKPLPKRSFDKDLDEIPF
jgi:hypothetical protein